MSFYRQSVGKKGEDIACNFLESNGYEIIERNFRTKYGELDIIASKDGILVFVEVKAKTDTRTGMPYETVNKNKIKHLMRAIQFYQLTHKVKDLKMSLDVISIIIGPDNRVKELKHFKSVDI